MIYLFAKLLVAWLYKHVSCFCFSAGGTGVLINLDRVAQQMSELAPDVEVRGLADSGWFLDYPQYRYKDCVEASSCAPVDVTKWGIR